jgi:hypothetical protein
MILNQVIKFIQFLPLLVFLMADKRANEEKKHTALVVSFDQRGTYMNIDEF